MPRFRAFCPAAASALLFLLTAVASAQPARIAPGERPLALDARGQVQFRLEVPEGAQRLTIETTDTALDLDLYVRFGQPIARIGQHDAQSTGMTGEETLSLRPTDRVPLRPGNWYILIANASRRGGRGTLRVTLEGSGSGPGPEPGAVPIVGDLMADTDTAVAFADGQEQLTWRFELPAGAQAVTIATSDTDVDLDLYVFDAPRRDSSLAAARWSSRGGSGVEELTIDGSTRPALPEPGSTLYVTLFNYPKSATTATLRASVGANTPVLPTDEAVAVTFSGRDQRDRLYMLTIPDEAQTLRLDLLIGDEDVDLYVRHGRPTREPRTADYGSDNSAGNEVLFLTREAGTLRSGELYVLVYNYANRRTEVELRARFDARHGGVLELATEPDFTIEPGANHPVRLPFNGRDHVVGKLTVPAGTRTMLLSLTPKPHEDDGDDDEEEPAEPDVDLYVGRDEPLPNLSAADAMSRADGATEEIWLSGDAVAAGDYFVVVHSHTGQAANVVLRVELNAPEPLPESVDGELTPGEPFPIPFPRRNRKRYYTLSFVVPESGVDSVLVRIAGAVTDLDLYVKHGSEIDTWAEGQYDYAALTPRPNEVLWFDGTSTPPLAPGRYFMDVRYRAGDETSATVVVEFNQPKPEDAVEGPVPSLPLITLQPGRPQEIELDRSTHKHQGFRIDVPAGASELHIAAYGSDSDLDVYVRAGQPVGDWDDEATWDHRAFTSRVDEIVVIDRNSEPPLQPGPYFFDVVAFRVDPEVSFSVVASIDGSPPMPALHAPPFRDMAALTLLQRAADACVAVESSLGSGSGTVLTPDGYVLTCFHVVGNMQTGTYESDGYLISFTDDPRYPPRQTHVARIVHADQELDLALLKIHSTVRGDAIRPEPGFAWLPIGSTGGLDLGDDLQVLGYPGIGGEISRTTITLTRGIVSGFESRARRVWWIKTDADISGGNSGGTVIDAAGNLIGVPTIVIHNADAILGFCRPVERIPAEWRREIAGHLPD